MSGTAGAVYLSVSSGRSKIQRELSRAQGVRVRLCGVCGVVGRRHSHESEPTVRMAHNKPPGGADLRCFWSRAT